MALADNPTIVNDIRVRKVPIIMTCNDSTKLYKALVRPSRTTHFNWVPTFIEKHNVLQKVFPECSSDEIEKLIVHTEKEYGRINNRKPNKELAYVPIAFYTQLKSKMYDESFSYAIKRYGLQSMITSSKYSHPSMTMSYGFNKLIKYSSYLLEEQKQRNYLEV